jgi:hypothetical protein
MLIAKFDFEKEGDGMQAKKVLVWFKIITKDVVSKI